MGKRKLGVHRDDYIRQATEFKNLVQAANALGLDYKQASDDSIYELKKTTNNDVKELSPHFAAVIKALNTSDYVCTRYDESLSRIILGLLLVDRLKHLKDEDTFRQLILSAEVPITIQIKDDDGNSELIKGRADWVLGYGKTKENTGSILVVIEAKSNGSASTGLPQLLVYMAAVQEARSGHTNNTVFGMVSDGAEFMFTFLDSSKKFHESLPLVWKHRHHQQEIISYIDAMLLDAIRSSPHTTPIKVSNKTLLRYPEYLKGRWTFGEDIEDDVETGGETDEDDIVDVIVVNGCIFLKKTRAETES